jgi:hypothetical protein
VFYSWLKQALENLQGAFAPRSNGAGSRERELAAENAQLKAKLAKKDGVIAEILAEYVQLKMNLGSPEQAPDIAEGCGSGAVDKRRTLPCESQSHNRPCGGEEGQATHAENRARGNGREERRHAHPGRNRTTGSGRHAGSSASRRGRRVRHAPPRGAR